MSLLADDAAVGAFSADEHGDAEAAAPSSLGDPDAQAPPVKAPSTRTSRGRVVHIGEHTITYDYQHGTARPLVFFLPGLTKSRYNAKATEMEMYCKSTGQPFVCADYAGTGRSSGDFIDGTLSLWTAHTVEILDRVLHDAGRVIFVGEGVGGWIALLVALRRPTRVSGIVGLAADPDFTEDLLWAHMSAKQKALLRDNGHVTMQWGFKEYPIGMRLIEDGRKNLVLQGDGREGTLDVDVPVRLIHGMSDEEIPPSRAIKLANRLRSTDVTVTLVKHGDHTLEDEDDFRRTNDAIAELSDKYFEYDLRSPSSG